MSADGGASRQHHQSDDRDNDGRTPMVDVTADVMVDVMVDVMDVSCSFGSLAVLDRVNLEVFQGEFVSLVGASGSGKTTLLRTIAGLQAPSHGSVAVNGQDPATARRSKNIALVPQSPALLPWRTVTDNVTVLLQIGETTPVDRGRIQSLIDDVGLAAFADAYPHELSGGMQQRVALARAFALDAPLLLLDEPFGALDEITRADMRHLLARLCEANRATVLFVTHSLPEAVYLSDRVGVLSDRPGRVTALHSIDLEHPRTPEVEDDPRFFAHVTAVRHDLQSSRGQSSRGQSARVTHAESRRE